MSKPSREGEEAREPELTWLQRLAVAVGPLLLRMLRATWRVATVNDEGWRALRAAGQPFIFSLWHGELLPLVVEHRGQGVRVLISEHRDGEVIAAIARGLGLDTIRGSTTRGAARALLAMCDALNAGSAVAVTPDGPRGPAHKYAGGALVAAHRSGAPVIAIGVVAARSWRLQSWDSFLIPKPFSSVTIAYSDPEFVEATDARAAAQQGEQFEQLMAATAGVASAYASAQAATHAGTTDDIGPVAPGS